LDIPYQISGQMMLLKRGLALIAGVFILLNNAYPIFVQDDISPEMMLKKASKSQNDPAAGITFAKKALQQAERKNNKSVIVRCLSLESQYFWVLKKSDSAKVYARNALTQAENYNIDSLKGDCWYSLGMISFSNNNLKQSIAEYNNALQSYQKSHQIAGIGTSYLGIGISEQGLTDYSNSINHYLQAANIFQNLKDKRYLAYTFNAIADCFNTLGDYKKTLYYNKMALLLRQKLRDDQGISESLNNIGFLYYKLKKADSAIFYLTKSLEIIKNDQDSSGLVLTLQDISSAHKIKHDFRRAERYSMRAQNIALKYAMKKELAGGNADLAEIYIGEKNYVKALKHINTAIDTAKKSNFKELLLKAYTVKYDIYKQSGDYKNALLYADKRSDLKDSIFTASRDRDITEMETKYKTVQTEKDRDSFRVQTELQQRNLSQQTKYIIVLSIAAILLAVLFVIAYNNFRKKNKANMRIQTLMKDLHHRVKNNLQILSGLFSMQIDNLSDENTKNALRENEARLTSMNLIHNKLYLDNTTTKIEMNDYLTKLLNHIKDSFGGTRQSEINLRIEVSNIMLEADKAVAIGLIANELATNSFKYAFNGKGGEIHLGLQLLEKSKILLTLADNGIGLEPENKDKAPSFGLKLVNLMARQLNSTLIVKSNPGVFYQMEISI
jgi:two-component sensor histidine kinase